jgi:sulfur relay protein TusB/DsrH
MNKFTPAEDPISILKLAGKLAEKSEETVFLHIQEACKAITSARYCDKLLEARIKIYALKADVEARELTGRVHPSVKLIDYRQWVSLLMDRHHRIVSWTG